MKKDYISIYNDLELYGNNIYRNNLLTKEIIGYSTKLKLINKVVGDKREFKSIKSQYLKNKNYLVNFLKNNIDTRQCVLRFLDYEKNIYMCISFLQFIFDSKKLRVISYWRSCDIKKLKQDVSIVSWILKDLSKSLKIKYCNDIICIFGSLHKYE